MPISSKDDLLRAVLHDLRVTLKSTISNDLLPPPNSESRKILEQLNEIFDQNTAKVPRVPTSSLSSAPTVSPVTATVPRVPTTVSPSTAPTANVPRVVPTHAPTPSPAPTADINAPDLMKRLRKTIFKDALRAVTDSRRTSSGQAMQNAHRQSSRVRKSTNSSDFQYANSTVEISPAEEEFIRQHVANMDVINSVMDPDTGKEQELKDLLKTKDKKHWEGGSFKELARLAQGSKRRSLQGTDTIDFITRSEMPIDKKPTYARVCANYREQKEDPYRVRITVGGDRIQYDGETFTPNADVTTAKILFNSVISTPMAKFLGIDIKDFYLMTKMDNPEFMYLPRWIFPQEFIDEYGIEDKFHNDKILVRINKGMYGLPQAGRLAYIELIKHLSEHGYVRAGLTPGLFKHVTRPTIFTLFVDDFGVKYNSKEDAMHLIQSLETKYNITIDWEGSTFLGMHLKWDYVNGTVELSMPGYVWKALIRFQHILPKKPQHSPHPHTPPTFGAKVQYAKENLESDLTPAQLKHIQRVIGVFLYYGRAIDSTIQPAVGSISSSLSTGQWEDIKFRTNHFLDYMATHPNAKLIYKK
eukprot:scaffold10166_cov289-Chaetoceros_neogracile.AAC.1